MKIQAKQSPLIDAEPLWYWINRRHNIYLRRKAGDPWPWTNDKILQDYRFCNVFRELDTVTKWIDVNWRKPFATHPNLWFAMCLARQINWPETLAEIGFPEKWNPERVRKILNKRKINGKQVYTGAYIITAGGRSIPKIDYTIDHVLTPLYRTPHVPNSISACAHTMHGLQDTHKFLMQFQGFGPFMAYEVVTDLRWTHYLRNARDIMSWANAGPGAKRGLNRIWGRPHRSSLSQEQALDEMQRLLKMSQHDCGGRRPLLPHVPALEMRDIEHSLCEVDKYLRVKNGQGKPRSKYRAPESA